MEKMPLDHKGKKVHMYLAYDFHDNITEVLQPISISFSWYILQFWSYIMVIYIILDIIHIAQELVPETASFNQAGH